MLLNWYKIRSALSQTIKKYASTLQNGLQENKVTINIAKWFDGIECEALKVGGKGWQKGTVKFSIILEFIPEGEESIEETMGEVIEGVLPITLESSGFSEARSPLDDIRQMNV